MIITYSNFQLISHTQTEMEQIKHYSHSHPLIICDELHSDNASNCYLCGKPMTVEEGGGGSGSSSSSYRCASIDEEKNCQNFFLHKTCAEAPGRIEHPIHHQHPDDLLRSDLGESICNVCDLRVGKVHGYFCFHLNCRFEMCLTCSFQKKRNIKHPGHSYEDHALSLVPRHALFRCDACGEKHEDSSYTCNACPFWIHQTCASLPTSIDCKIHPDHPLTLAYFLPERYCGSKQSCAICYKKLNPNYWLYYCVGCRVFAHIKCATSTDTPLRSSENDEANPVDPNLFHVPVTSESSIDLMIQQFGKANSLTDGGDMPVVADCINHWAHKDHPLVLFDQLQRNNINTTESQMLCDGCVRPILSDPFYGCARCNFFLHTFCAELPMVAKHPSHEEHELDIHKFFNPNFYVKCDLCGNICNGMFYYCKRCTFYLDIKCVSLPSTIKYATHRHPLRQICRLSLPFCRGCGVLNANFWCFACKDCKFYLEASCIFLPGTINHRWDPHPIPLVHPPIKDHPDEFYCEICETEIDGISHSFYFCRACDQSFHTKCLYPYYGYSNVKLGATNITVNEHPHSLTFVAMQQHKLPSNFSKCGCCGHHIPDGSPMLECKPCHFRLCYRC